MDARIRELSPFMAQRLDDTDYNYQQPTLAFADRQADLGGAPVYAYAFDWRSPARAGVLGAAHTAEVPFIFGTLDAARALVQDSPDQLQVRDRMGAIWGQFARSGQPGGGDSGVQGWQPYERVQRLTARKPYVRDPIRSRF